MSCLIENSFQLQSELCGAEFGQGGSNLHNDKCHSLTL